MTFNEIVQDTMNNLNLTSTEARDRIGVYVNARYKKTTSSIGLITSRRISSTIVVDPTDTITYPNLPQLTINTMEKVLKVALIVETSIPKILPQVTYDQISALPTLDTLPRAWCVVTMGAGHVTIQLDSVTATDTFTLNVEGYDITDTLSGTNVPFLPTDFHDILIEGAMADQLNKMEKPALAAIHDAKYEARLSDLRMFIAKAAWMDLYQGKTKPRSSWYWPWYSRTSQLGIE